MTRLVVKVTWSYTDRAHAGKVLSKKLREIQFEGVPFLLAVPAGGVAVAEPVVDALNADFDLIIVRKIQIPYNPEAGFGAITSLGSVMLNEELVARIGLTQDQIDAAIKKTESQITERTERYAGLVGKSFPSGREVILIDDGLASGYTMLAAIQSIKSFKPTKITVAVPTASASAVARVDPVVDRLICPRKETGYVFAVADAYQHWYDVPDEEVIQLLRRIHKKSR